MNTKNDSPECPFLSIPNDMKPIIALIHRAEHDCNVLFNARLERIDLTSKSFLILGASYNNTTFSQKDIAEAFFIDRTTMVNLVDELESRGLVERIRHVEDRRQYRIILTSKGELLFKQAREIAYQVEDEYLGVLSAKQKEDLRGSLLLVLNHQNEKKNLQKCSDTQECWAGVKAKVKDIKAKVKKAVVGASLKAPK